MTTPVFASSQAAGIRTTICRQTETMSEFMLLENAWKIDPITMPQAASGKFSEMMRSAGTPSVSMSSDALKKPSSCVGNRWKHRVPMSMIETASMKENFRASEMRSFFLAP